MSEKAASLKEAIEELLVQSDMHEVHKPMATESKENHEHIQSSEQLSMMSLPIEVRDILDAQLALAEKNGKFGPFFPEMCFNEYHLPIIISEINKRPKITEFHFVQGISCQNRLSDKEARYIAEHIGKFVHTLGLYGHAITDEGIKCLAVRSTIKTLLIGATQVSDVGIKILAENNTLEGLNISNCFNLTEKSGEYLSMNTSLKRLSLHQGIGAHSLTEAERDSGNNNFMIYLSQNKTLNKIVCPRGTSDKAVLMLSEIPTLTSLEIRACDKISVSVKRTLLETTQRRKKQQLWLLEQARLQVLLGTHARIGSNSTLLYAFTNQVICDKRSLLREIFKYNDAQAVPLTIGLSHL